MQDRGITTNLGIYVYGAGAIFLGVLGLASGDFATTWQNVGPSVPLRVPLAYLAAVIEVAAGLALLLPRTARAGALALTIVYSVFTVIWVPKALVNLGNFDPIGNVFEEFSSRRRWSGPACNLFSGRILGCAKPAFFCAPLWYLPHIFWDRSCRRHARSVGPDPGLVAAG